MGENEKERRYVSPANNFNKDLAKVQQQIYTIAQWLMSIAIIFGAATSLFASGILSAWSNMWMLSVAAAEFAVMLVIGLLGGLLPKADVPIHTIGEELWQVGDWHENLRSLDRKKWLNVLPDIFGLSTGVFLFVVANLLIVQQWRSPFPVWIVVTVNCILLVLAAAMIPISCAAAHREVEQQVKINENLSPNKKGVIFD